MRYVKPRLYLLASLISVVPLVPFGLRGFFFFCNWGINMHIAVLNGGNILVHTPSGDTASQGSSSVLQPKVSASLLLSLCACAPGAAVAGCQQRVNLQ